jgi:6-pyruvoyltetrahydropterin/6-carboxytetrahydropterin synthase
MSYQSTKLLELGSCAFRQWRATHSHCSKIHGYQLLAKFYFGASSLDEKNWVVDFAGLKTLKATLQQQFDHTLCVAKDDPLLELFQQLHNAGGCDIRIMDSVGIEKTAEYCFKAAQNFLKETYGDRCWVEKVEVFEHEANSAVYIKDTNANEVVVKTETPVNNESIITPNIEPTLPTPERILHPIESPPAPPSNAPKDGPVPLRNPVTSGYSGMFDGTSWGRR